MEDIEARVDELGVSSLIVELGGLGVTFPTLVSTETDLRSTIDAATEEWLHQYLFFTPLGFRYALDTAGIRPDYQVATLNETVAGMVSREIGSVVYNRYYRKGGTDQAEARPSRQESEFNREMRQIRLTVNDYLARGEVTQAEQYMEDRRVFLASKGYFIRKLNQAYFAFYGTYGDHPMTVSPIGTEMRELGAKATCLKDFLDTTSKMTSREDLLRLVGAR